MAKADETGASGIMQRFMNRNYNFTHRINHQQQQLQSEGEETEEIELSLGLSLNGRFGVDPTRAKKLARSSSIPDFINDAIAKDKNDTVFAMPVGCSNLIRTCSLPTETEEEWVKRKELQTLRRMEAKRKRSEKQKNLRIARDRVRVSGEENNNGEEDRRENAGNVIVNSLPPSWVNGGKGIVFKGGGGADGRLPPVATQGSNGSSQGTGSSGVSELESQPTQALKKCTGAVSPPSLDSTPRSENKSPITTEVATAEKPGNNFVRVGRERVPASSRVADYGVEAVMTDVLDAMPSVSTRGDGPNGRRIEGFLYRYKKGEEVRIVCVCHGQFLSPAQFVKHAGGGDVEHPLKHIVVNPSPYL